jgi:glycosyltransferase involved in cell wall biosynthesis
MARAGWVGVNPGERPTFSIVVPVRDGAKVIARCVDSIIAQTTSDWELIVMDAASTDGTQAILARYGDKITYWESEPDRGICHAWNKAIERSRGMWVIFLGADDRLASDGILSRARDMLPEGRDTGVAYGTVELEDAAGHVVGIAGRSWEEIRGAFLKHNTIPHQAVFHNRSLFDRNGRFDESFRICGDYEFLMRELRYRSPVYMPDLLVANVAATGISMRPGSSYLATREMRRAQLRHGVVSTPAWRSFRLVRATAYEAIRRAAGPASARRAANLYHRVASRSADQHR